MTKLTKKDSKKIAYLARLPLTYEEIETFTPQLEEVLDYFERLKEVNTDSVEPTFHPSDDKENRFQEQEASADTLSQDDVLSNVPQKKDGYVVIDAVLEE